MDRTALAIPSQDMLNKIRIEFPPVTHLFIYDYVCAAIINIRRIYIQTKQKGETVKCWAIYVYMCRWPGTLHPAGLYFNFHGISISFGKERYLNFILFLKFFLLEVVELFRGGIRTLYSIISSIYYIKGIYILYIQKSVQTLYS
jgi:hypothetical protein